MSLLAPISLGLVGIAAAVGAGLLVVAYILKMRRRRFEVPFSTLWSRVLREKEATTWWKHLRRILSLLLVALIFALTVFAVTEPRLGSADKDARNVVVVIDSSASMQTIDEEGDGGSKVSRLIRAKQKARDLLDAMGAGDAAMIVRMDGQSTPLSRFVTDKSALKRSLESLEATDTPADLRRALSAAADALHDRQNGLIVVIGDGAYPQAVLDSVVLKGAAADAADAADKTATDEERKKFEGKKLDVIDLSKSEFTFIPVGKSGDNVGIVAFNVRRYISNKMSYEVFIEIQNFGEEVAKRKLVLKNGELAIDVKEIELKPGERQRAIYPDRGGGNDNMLTAELQLIGDTAAQTSSEPMRDIFPLDDVAYALLPARKKQKVLLVTIDNLYLEGAMLVYDDIGVDKLAPAEYEASMNANKLPPYSAIVFDDYTPKALPPERTHLLYFNPDKEGSPFPIAGSIRRPKIDNVNDDHPVMRWITMSDVNFDQSSKFKLNRQAREVPLLRSIAPIAAAKRSGGRKVVAFGFSLSGTDLTLRVAFPLMLVNILDWFAGDDADLITTYTTGRRVRVPLDGTVGINEVDVELPARAGKLRVTTKAPVANGRASFYAQRVGVHKMTAREDGEVVGTIGLAANLSSPTESNIAPNAQLAVGETAIEEPSGFKITRKQSIWLYLALLVLILLGVEWFTYNRRITV